MKKPRSPSPKKRASGEIERIRQLFEESDERVAKYFQKLEGDPAHVARRPTSSGHGKDSSALE